MINCPCRRVDLPPAPGMPLALPVPCAHVRVDGTPCPGSPTGMYDAEVLAVIVTEDGLWALPGDPAPSASSPPALEEADLAVKVAAARARRSPRKRNA